jgi:hypothetical protein
MAKKKKKRKLSLAEKKKYIKMASHGVGKEFLLGVKMLGGVATPGAGAGVGHH